MSNKMFKFIGDREKSTYRHIIYLKPENRIGSVSELEGYNKHKYHEEPFDKVKCFVDYVSRICCSNLHKATVIVFFTNNRSGKDNDEELLFITPKSYKVGAKFMHIQPLIDFCEDVKLNGISQVEKKTKTISTKVNYDDKFIYKEGLFSSLAHLQTYCRTLVNSGVPEGRVQGYFYDVQAKYSIT